MTNQNTLPEPEPLIIVHETPLIDKTWNDEDADLFPYVPWIADAEAERIHYFTNQAD